MKATIRPIMLKLALATIRKVFKLSKKAKIFNVFRLLFAPVFARTLGKDYIDLHIQMYEDYIKDNFTTFLGSTDCKRVLDIGCGAGVLTKSVNGIGTDYNLYPQWTGGIFIISDANHLPFKNNSFDIVIMSNLLEHVKAPFDVINEANRVCRDRIYVSFPTIYSLSSLYHYLSKSETFAFYGGLNYTQIIESFSDFKIEKEKDRFLPITLRNNFSNPEIIFKKYKHFQIY